MSNASVRISLATWAADLAAVVWPGLAFMYVPRTTSAAQIQALAARVSELERLRGIRPGTVGIVPMVESPLGVSRAGEIAASSERVRAFGVGPNIAVGLEDDGDNDLLAYARAVCELHARALGLDPLDIRRVLD
jgi:citrate lyase subunit beta/citryl-CoA lyase